MKFGLPISLAACLFAGCDVMRDESGIDLTPPPSVDEVLSETEARTVTMWLDPKSALSIDGHSVGLGNIEDILSSADIDDDVIVILRVSENSKHSALVKLKDAVDATGARSIIEITAGE